MLKRPNLGNFIIFSRALCGHKFLTTLYLQVVVLVFICLLKLKFHLYLCYFFFSKYLVFEEAEDPANRSFFSEIISSISDVKFSRSGRYMLSRDYLSVKVWDLHMETKPIETYPVHEYLRSKLCSLYENDCIFDKFECCWGNNDQAVLTGSYNNFFRMFDRTSKRDVTLEASREIARPKTTLKAKKICSGGKRKKDEVSVDSLDFNKKILHTAWHPTENIIAVAATNNLFIFQDKFWRITGERRRKESSRKCSEIIKNET